MTAPPCRGELSLFTLFVMHSSMALGPQAFPTGGAGCFLYLKDPKDVYVSFGQVQVFAPSTTWADYIDNSDRAPPGTSLKLTT